MVQCCKHVLTINIGLVLIIDFRLVVILNLRLAIMDSNILVTPVGILQSYYVSQLYYI